METKIKNFTDLIAWQESHMLVKMIYEIIATFPTCERFGLSDQLRRAAISITSNIAEGFSRQTLKEKIQFYYISLGSLSEVQNQIILSEDLGYINNEIKERIMEQSVFAQKLINGMVRALRAV